MWKKIGRSAGEARMLGALIAKKAVGISPECRHLWPELAIAIRQAYLSPPEV